MPAHIKTTVPSRDGGGMIKICTKGKLYDKSNVCDGYAILSCSLVVMITTIQQGTVQYVS
jgi:hypothetical protein